jgi:branched-subunit amino acid ABC-type transport system permease component
MDPIAHLRGQVTLTIFDRGNYIDLPFVVIGAVVAASVAFRKGRHFWLLAALEAAFLIKVAIPYVTPFVEQPTRFVLHNVQSIVATVGYGLLAVYAVASLYTERIVARQRTQREDECLTRE